MSYDECTVYPQACPFGTQSREQNEEDDPLASMKRDYKNAVERLKKTKEEYASKLQQFEDEEKAQIQTIKAHWKAKKQALLQDRDEYTAPMKIEISFWENKLQLGD